MSSPSITVPEVSTHKATNESSADEIGDMPWESGFDSRETHRSVCSVVASCGYYGMASSSPLGVARSLQ
jgi:hypothetical protein